MKPRARSWNMLRKKSSCIFRWTWSFCCVALQSGVLRRRTCCSVQAISSGTRRRVRTRRIRQNPDLLRRLEPRETQPVKHTLDWSLLPEVLDTQVARRADIDEDAYRQLDEQLDEGQQRVTEPQAIVVG